jgi:hypothetical protein
VFRRRISPSDIPAPTGLPTTTEQPGRKPTIDPVSDAGAPAR